MPSRLQRPVAVPLSSQQFEGGISTARATSLFASRVPGTVRLHPSACGRSPTSGMTQSEGIIEGLCCAPAPPAADRSRTDPLRAITWRWRCPLRHQVCQRADARDDPSGWSLSASSALLRALARDPFDTDLVVPRSRQYAGSSSTATATRCHHGLCGRRSRFVPPVTRSRVLHEGQVVPSMSGATSEDS